MEHLQGNQIEKNVPLPEKQEDVKGLTGGFVGDRVKKANSKPNEHPKEVVRLGEPASCSQKR